MTKDVKKIIKIITLSLLFLFILIYIFFRSYDLIFGVKIKNVNINDNTVTTENLIKITGNAKNAKNLYLNGREITVEKNGDFGEYIALISGYNIIEIKALDKFGSKDEKNYKIIYKPLVLPKVETEVKDKNI